MVVTRSNKTLTEEQHPMKKSNSRKNFVITIAPKSKKRAGIDDDDNSSNENDESEYETDDDESFDDEFDLPRSIMEDENLRKKAEDVIQYIKNNSPSLETILNANIRRKHKAELFEWFMIYENTMPMSEERMVLRQQVYRMLQNCEKEYTEYNKYKDEIKTFEANHTQHNDLVDLQYDIVKLPTSSGQKQVLYRKYSELREKDDMDEEYCKLKTWLKQALQLPFDRIKSFPIFDDITQQLLHVRRIFDEELYGMEKVKEQLLLFIHGKIMNPDMKGCCLGLVGEPGVGKCLHPSTEVLMYDGSIRQARDLQTGDELMGDDSRPRRIQSMCFGKQLMYRVLQQNGDSYVVNSSHILTLYHKKSGTIRDVPISEYLHSSRDTYCGVKTSIEFPLRKLTFPEICPRVMGGLWACRQPSGDFMSVQPYLTKYVKDSLLKDFFQENGDRLPVEFKLNTSSIRLGFLRGVIDECGIQYDMNYSVFLPPGLIEDFLYLARSLGLYSKKTKRHTVTLSDPLDMIKSHEPRFPVLVTYDILLRKLDVQDYVGFILDENHRFLLKDCTITHNTSIARCLAKVLDFPFEQISFGGIHHADFIKGFDFTYVGSRPGEIARCLSRMKYKNGIIFFDEYEKISENSEVTSTLLHITDFSQNNTFRDNYFNELTIDLSSVWFIYSMNDLPKDKALKDRIYSIRVEGYSEKEKVRIACDYLFPKNLVNIGKDPKDIIASDEVIKYLVQKICRGEKGIRNLEKAVKDILNKTHFLTTNQDKIPCSFMLPGSYFPMKLPVELTKTMIDVFLKDFSKEAPLPSFYG